MQACGAMYCWPARALFSFLFLFCFDFFSSFNFVVLRLLHSLVPEITTDVSVPSIEFSHCFIFFQSCAEAVERHCCTYKSVSVCNFHAVIFNKCI